jgi:hypothetical protein
VHLVPAVRGCGGDPVIALPVGVLKAAGAVWGFLRGIPWQAWAVVGVLLAGWAWGHHQYRAGQAEVQVRWDAERAVMVGKLKAVQDAAEAARKARIKRGRWILTELTRERDEAINKGRAVAADLRAGRLRLRDHWTCPRVPAAGAAAAPSGGDAAADLRATGAGDLVRLGADADRLLRACQRVIEADRAQLRSPTPD